LIRRLYDWVLALAERPGAIWALAMISFAESSFFPIPPDAMIVPMILARPAAAWRIALVATVSSVAGGILGYAIGFFLFETIGERVIAFYGLQEGFARFRALYGDWGLWVILIKGLTPIPYKLVTIASGAAAFDPLVFLLASIATRGARFFLLAALLRRFGPPIRLFVEKYLTLLTLAIAVSIVGGFLMLRFL
jgi:membrane protein YqaA with SNARE-associated domain